MPSLVAGAGATAPSLASLADDLIRNADADEADGDNRRVESDDDGDGCGCGPVWLTRSGVRARTVLLSSRQPALKTRAEKIFTAINGSRQEVFARYQPVATKGPGDAIRGREVFGRHCITCHKVGETGHTVGPELKAALQGKDKDALLLAILDPSREIDPRFAQMVMETGDGRTIAGLLAAETPVSVTLRRAEGIEETVLRANLESLTATGKSLMPEGLEAQITPAQMGDLLEYLLQFGKGG